MIDLPIDATIPEVLAAVRSRRSLVLVAPPGAGKTTRVPVALARSGLLPTKHPALVLLQPRRVAARASAARIAEENRWSLGREVGYQVRFERRIGPETRVRVLTEGVLTRQLLADPFLEGVGAVVIDEFHERSLHSDLALALLREVRESVREDLILVVMSATLEAEPVARYLGDCPIVRVEGRSYPVAVEHVPAAPREPLHERTARGLEIALGPGDPGGHILAFLPGMEEIRRTARAVQESAHRADLDVLPLHGALPSEEQDRAIRPSRRRKLILATNVAETSLTIDGVRTVIDTGFARIAEFDPQRGLDRLELRRISRASATQRTGRAGRTGPGRCLRLWSERDERGMPTFETPEVTRVDLCGAVLSLRSWGQHDLARFGWFETPPDESLAGAERLLTWLGALGADGRITPLGERLLRVPIHPRLGRLLWEGARGGRLRESATLAALISEKDILARPPSGAGRPRATGLGVRARGDSDLLFRLDLFHDAERHGFRSERCPPEIDATATRRVARVRDDLIRAARGLARVESEAPPGQAPRSGHDDADLLRHLLLAYPDRVVRRRSRGGATGVMVGGRGVRLDDDSAVHDAEFFLALDPRDDRRGGALELRTRIASAIERDWLEAEFGAAIHRERALEFDEDAGKVVAVSRTCYHDLILKDDRHGPVEASEAGAVLATAFRERAEAFVREDERAAAWLDRLACLRGWMPELELPAFDQEKLAEILELACSGCRSIAEVRRIPLVPLLAMQLGRHGSQMLEQHAPEALSVPSGSRIRLSYLVGRPPVLAVRLQELFGWAETPRVAAGRVAVLLHLLGPNYRPVQITDDLRSFWSNTYTQVRKDLRARYPKHAWPEDPWTARPEAKGRPRRD